MSTPLTAPAAPADPVASAAPSAAAAAAAPAAPRPTQPLRWSATDRKALLMGAIFFEDDAEAVAQLLPDKQASEVEAACESTFKGSHAHACLVDLRARGFQPASLMGGWRREVFVQALARAGANHGALARASAALYAFDRGRVNTPGLVQMLLAAVGPQVLVDALDLTSPFLVEAVLAELWQGLVVWNPDEQQAADAPQGEPAEALPPSGKHICANCGACQTRVWRHGWGLTLCNACGMYAQKHSSHRPAELIRIHLQRLEREKAMAEEERRAAMVTPTGDNADMPGLLPNGAQPMEEDGAAPRSTPRGAAASELGGEAWTEPGGAASDGSPSVRRSRRPKAARRLDAAFVSGEAIDWSLGALRGSDMAATPTSLAPAGAHSPWLGAGGGSRPPSGEAVINPNTGGNAGPEWMQEDGVEGQAMREAAVAAAGAHQAVEALLERCSHSESDATAELAAEGLMRLRCDTPPGSPLSKASSHRDTPGSGRQHYRVRSPDPSLLGPGSAAARHAAATAAAAVPPAFAAGAGVTPTGQQSPWVPAGGLPPVSHSEADDAGSRAASPCTSIGTGATQGGAGATPPTPPGSWVGGAATAAQQALTRFGAEHRRSFNSSVESGAPVLASMRAAAERLRLAEGGSRGPSPDVGAAAATFAGPASGGARFAGVVGETGPGFPMLGVATLPMSPSSSRRRRHPRRDSSSDEEWVPGEEGGFERGGGSLGARGRKGWATGGGYAASDGDEPLGYGLGRGGAAAGGLPLSGAAQVLPLSPLSRLPVAAATFGALHDGVGPRSESAPPSGRGSPVLGTSSGGRSKGRSGTKEPKSNSRGPCANCGIEKSILWRCHPLDDTVRLCNACGIYRRSTGRDRPTDGVFRGLGKDGQERVIRRTAQSAVPKPHSSRVITPAAEYRSRLAEEQRQWQEQDSEPEPQTPVKATPTLELQPPAPKQQQQQPVGVRPASQSQPVQQPAAATPAIEAVTVAAVIQLLQQHQQQLALQHEQQRQQQNAALAAETAAAAMAAASAAQAAAAVLQGGGVARRGVAPVAAPVPFQQQAWALPAALLVGGRDASGASTPVGGPDSPGGGAFGERTALRVGARKRRVVDASGTAGAAGGESSGAAGANMGGGTTAAGAPGALEGRRT